MAAASELLMVAKVAHGARPSGADIKVVQLGPPSSTTLTAAGVALPDSSSQFENSTSIAPATIATKPWCHPTAALRDALATLHAAGTHPDHAARIARELDERGAAPARVPAALLLRLACPALPGRC